jgi:Skp family chaperone for outer membrane proteins
MFKRVLVLALVAGIMVFAGCDGDKGGGSAGTGGSSGRVAVVDLGKIIKDIGQADDIAKTQKILENNLRVSVYTIQQNVQKELNSKIEELGKRPEAKVPTAPTDDEKKLITEWVVKARGLEQARLNATNKIRQAVYEQRRKNQASIQAAMGKMGERIRPLAKKIAKAKGLEVVVDARQVFSFGEAVDITEAVSKEVSDLLKAGSFPKIVIPPVKSPPPAPAPAPTTAPAKP